MLAKGASVQQEQRGERRVKQRSLLTGGGSSTDTVTEQRSHYGPGRFEASTARERWGLQVVWGVHRVLTRGSSVLKDYAFESEKIAQHRPNAERGAKEGCGPITTATGTTSATTTAVAIATAGFMGFRQGTSLEKELQHDREAGKGPNDPRD